MKTSMIVVCGSVLLAGTVQASGTPDRVGGRSGHAAEPQFRTAEVFCDNMVLQRDAPVPVWGWAKSGQKATVTFAGQGKAALAGKDGKWTVTLDPMPACAQARVMTVSAGNGKPKTIRGVVVGDVWLCSGQSNIVFGFGASKRPDGFPLDYPLIREFTVPRSFSLEKQTSFKPPRAMAGHVFEPATEWFACGPRTAGRFTAVGLFAAIEMFKELKIPIGIVNCSFNGSAADYWVPSHLMKKDPLYGGVFERADKQVEHYRKTIDRYESDQALFMKMKKELAQADKAAPSQGDTCEKGLQGGWMKPDADTKGWTTIPWGWFYGSPNYIWDGESVVWFRTLCLGAKPKGDIHLRGGAFRNCRVRHFFNGRELEAVGRTKDGQPQFVIKRSELRKNRGVLVIRAAGNRKLACLWRAPSSNEMRVLFPQGAYRVAECSKRATPFRLAGHKYPPSGAAVYPGTRFNAMLNPLIPYALKGFIWYQGESDTGGMDRARLYAHTLPLLVKTWRDAWGGEPKPFVVVQLAGYIGDPKRTMLAELRESQKAVLALPNTALSPSMDIREPNNWHPRNKYDIGVRAGRSALAVAYGKPIPFSGPMFKTLKVEGDTIRVFFDHVGTGLVIGEKQGLAPVTFLPDRRVPHFLIAGKDGTFVPAEAAIDGETVVVRSGAIKQPVAVRYAWTNMPLDPLLYNRHGLPACSFRSDKGDTGAERP